MIVGDIFRNKDPYKGETRYKVIRIIKGMIYAMWETNGYMSGFLDEDKGFTMTYYPSDMKAYEKCAA